MARLALLGGAYTDPGLIASAQRRVNLYAERNPPEAQSPVNTTHYVRPGLTPLSSPPSPGFGRGLYTATDGELFAVVNQDIFHVHDADYSWHLIGSMQTPLTTPVKFADNGTTALIVDGSLQGYSIDLATQTGHAFNQIGDPNFLGGTNIDFLDYYLFLNQPNSPNWYCTEANSTLFNALFFGTKTAWPDDIQTAVAVQREVWILGKYKSEIWYNSGTVPFPFQAQPGVIIEHGCVAPYSAAKQDVYLYWLSQSPEGARMVMRGSGKKAERISTHAIESEFLTYPRVDDAIGAVYQIRGHAFYKLHFPTADRTWGYDEATKQWHEDAWFDTNGIQHRARNTFCAYAYGKNVALDWNSGDLYQIDETNFTDNGTAIPCICSVPHLLDNESYNRITVWKLIADMETGTGTGTVNQQTTVSPWSLGFSSGFGPRTVVGPPTISARVSRTRGNSWGNRRTRPMGAAGQYNTTPMWPRWGTMRDGVFELSWATPQQTALNGVFVEYEIHEGDQ